MYLKFSSSLFKLAKLGYNEISVIVRFREVRCSGTHCIHIITIYSNIYDKRIEKKTNKLIAIFNISSLHKYIY